MQDQLFDPTPTLSVGELTGRIRTVVERTFGDEVWVQGEVQGLDPNRRPDSHLFFDLVEPGRDGRAQAKLGVALFADNRRGVNAMLRRAGGMRMEDGLDVRLRGSVNFWPRSGRIQFKMTAIDPVHTLGALEAERQRVLAALAAEDLVARNGRLPLAELPLRVAVVTSAQGAAVHDFVAELRASAIGWRVEVHDVRVQGRDAITTIAAAVAAIDTSRADVVALIRGGGSRNDLAAFDSEAVARAVAGARVPVITGLGHETDRAVADVVAHASLKTPTACASWLIERARAQTDRMEAAWTGVLDRAEQNLAAAADRQRHHAGALEGGVASALAGADRVLVESRRRASRTVALRVAAADNTLDAASSTLVRRGPRAADRPRRRLDDLAARLTAYDPARTLARGWALLRDEDGRFVRQVADVTVDQKVTVQVADGAIGARVTDVPAADANSTDPDLEPT